MTMFAMTQVAVEYGVITSRSMTSIRSALQGVEPQTWLLGGGVLLLLFLVVRKL
jgi:hypothetical protein